MKTAARIWLITTSCLWLLLWIVDAADSAKTHSHSSLTIDLLHASLVLLGLVFEGFEMRIAPLVNVGYFGIYGVWVLVVASRSTDRGDSATAIVLLALPLIAQAISNFAVYRYLVPREGSPKEG